jgi:cytochrome c553
MSFRLRSAAGLAKPLPLLIALTWLGFADRPFGQGVDIPARKAEMRGHYSQLLAIHDAVVRGDLQAVREPATELAYLSVPPGSPFGATRFGAAIREGARRLARESTVTGAARATVSIVRECSGCHRASGAAISKGPLLERRMPSAMTDHARGADEMLIGLLLPSDTEWLAGAGRLQSTLSPLRQNGRPDSLLDDATRSLTDRATRATTATARASAYVQLLATCAECHQARRR